MPLTFLVLGVLGGLGLFILGMKTMSEGLLKLTGAPLRHRLEQVAGNRMAGVLFGSILSSALQSSGAAAIIVIGFVNAGLLSLYQSLAILLGTSIGTTIAVQFIAFKFFFFSPAAIFLGVMLKLFGKRRRMVYCGEVILGIGLLFFGLEIMETNFNPLEKTAIFQAFHSLLLSWKINAVLLGAFLTIALQSGSATIAVVMTLAGTGILSVETGSAMVLGECIGTSALAVIGTIGGTLAARRAGIMYLLTAVVAVSVTLLLFSPFMAAVRTVSPAMNEMTAVKDVAARTIANSHTFFSLLLVLVGLPLTGILSRAGVKIVRGKVETIDIEPRSQYLDDKVLNTPSIAYIQARNELKRMMQVVGTMFEGVVSLFNDYNTKTVEEVKHMENVLDILQREISAFLVKLLQQPITPLMFNEIPGMLRTVENLEQIGDLSEMIVDCLRRKKEDRIYFTQGAMKEITELADAVAVLVRQAKARIAEEEEPSADPDLIMRHVSDMRTRNRQSHIERLTSGHCSVPAGLLYNDISSGFEKIAQNCLMIIESEKKHVESSH